MVCTEMISCHGLVHGQQKTRRLLASHGDERPLAVQLFGADPEMMARAATIVSQEPVDCLDINMGCPVRKVVRKGAGAALMRQPELAARIIRAVVRATHLPVTVKFRSGWDSSSITAPRFAAMAEECGAAAVTVHARTWSQQFGGQADWQVIGQVVEAVTIPVIGNGDIHSFADARNMQRQTGCFGVMVGRGALGNPWVFSAHGRPPTLAARLPVMQRHLALARTHLDERCVLFRIKNHLCRYLAGLPGARRLREAIFASTSLEALDRLLDTPSALSHPIDSGNQ